MRKKLDAKAIQAELEATQDAHFQERRPELVSWVRALQQAASPADFMRLQLKLRDRFAGRQDAMRLRTVDLETDKAELKRLAPLRPRQQGALDELRRRITIRERLHRRDSVLQHISRCLADAMVWRATRWDRALFTVLGEGERVGRLPEEDGAKPERERAQALWDQGVLPFFNDLTNCLRQGDLTVLHGAWPDASVAVDEVKRSGRRPMDSRQAKRLDRKLELLSKEWDPTGAAGGPLSLWRLPVPYRHELAELAAVLAQARRDGYAEAQLHPSVVVSAVDLKWAFANRDQVDNWMARAADVRGWDPRDERHFWSSALVTRMSERRRAGSSYHAPIGIFPLCAEDIVDVLMGVVDYNVTLRVDAGVPAFADRQIAVEFGTGREADEIFLRARRGGDEITVPAHLREQMLRELMTVETLVDIVDRLLEAVSLGAPPDVKRIVVCDERDSWPDRRCISQPDRVAGVTNR
jgi:hypothetical protein